MSSANQRALAAFRAMRELGILAEKIKPNLKKLLKLYENNWELIERENYGALADFIFESKEEEEEEGHKVKEANFEAPLSNPLLGQEFPLKRPKLEKAEQLGGGGGSGGGKWLVSGVFGSGSKRPLDDDDASVRKDSTRTEELLEYRVPGNDKRKYGDYSVSDQPRRSVTTPKTASIPDSPSSDFEIASSELGEVKVSMHLDIASEQPDFCVPNIDSVFKMVEDKCIKTYQIKDPNFSLKKLMEDFCESCLEAGTETENKGTKLSVHPAANNVLNLNGKVQRTSLL